MADELKKNGERLDVLEAEIKALGEKIAGALAGFASVLDRLAKLEKIAHRH